MRIQVSGKQIDVGEALRTHVEDRIDDVVGKYSDRPVDATVVFSKDGHELVADASVHLSTGLTAQARSRASEIYAAFDGALERMEKQLRRYKRRLKDHHANRDATMDAMGASAYILAGGQDEDEEVVADGQPIVVAEMETRVMSLSVADAVMHMELSGVPLLVFRNSSHGGVNVIYMRDDGNIGWIDPRNTR